MFQSFAWLIALFNLLLFGVGAYEMSANMSRLYVNRLAEVSALTLVLITMQEKVKIPRVMIRRCYRDNFV